MLNREKIVEELLHNIHAMRHKLMVGYASKKDCAITPSQAFVLRFVAKNNIVNIKSITEVMHITSSAATQLVDGLVLKGYLLRKSDPLDKRVVSLGLSDKAKKVFSEFKKEGAKKMTEIFSALTDDELVQYAGLSKKLIDHITINKCKK